MLAKENLMFDIYNRDYSAQLLSEMQSFGLSPHSINFLCADGALHRYTVHGDKPGTKNGWYVIYQHEIVCAVFGSWKTGAKHVWCSANRSELKAEVNAEIFKKISQAKKLFAIRKKEEQSLAAERAFSLWNSFIPANSFHPYLLKKRITPFTARQTGGDLVLPIIDCDNKIWSLQYIDPNGRKLLFAGGAKKGNFIPVHGCLSSEEIGIAEGFATAATIAKEHPHMCVIAAIDAGNLETVAIAIRNRKPYAEITIFGDDDRLTESNPGATKAWAAAVCAGAQVCLPPWPFDAPPSLSDFNDLACWFEDNYREIENDE